MGNAHQKRKHQIQQHDYTRRCRAKTKLKGVGFRINNNICYIRPSNNILSLLLMLVFTINQTHYMKSY